MIKSDSASIWLYDVPADRADDFEAWFRTTMVPLVDDHHPELKGRWQILRADNPEQDIIVFGILMDGIEGTEWEIQPLLEDALSAEDAKRALEALEPMIARDYGWVMTPVITG